jgi:hypothetical protein
MNVIDKITRFIIPIPLYDVGAGIYHIFKKDVTQEQCEKIVLGAVRIAAVAAIILTGAVLAIYSANLVGLALCGAIWISYFLDQQTGTFLLSSLSMSMGILGLVAIISNIAKGILENLGILIMGQFTYIGSSGLINWLGWYKEGGLFGKEINERCKIWSIDLYLRLYDTHRTKTST